MLRPSTTCCRESVQQTSIAVDKLTMLPEALQEEGAKKGSTTVNKQVTALLESIEETKSIYREGYYNYVGTG